MANKGGHAYHGSTNSRAKRQKSKIYKGMKMVDTAKSYEQIEREKSAKLIVGEVETALAIEEELYPILN